MGIPAQTFPPKNYLVEWFKEAQNTKQHPCIALARVLSWDGESFWLNRPDLPWDSSALKLWLAYHRTSRLPWYQEWVTFATPHLGKPPNKRIKKRFYLGKSPICEWIVRSQTFGEIHRSVLTKVSCFPDGSNRRFIIAATVYSLNSTHVAFKFFELEFVIKWRRNPWIDELNASKCYFGQFPMYRRCIMSIAMCQGNDQEDEEGWQK